MPDLPASISRYQIVEQLAVGDAGAVYKAFDPMIERMVAVKVLAAGRDATTIDAGVKETFYREMQKAGTLNHPAIAMLFDVGEAQEGLFAAAEFVDGSSLSSGVPAGLDVRARIALIGQVADALEYAQEMGVPHLNVKASSVLVRSDLSVKVSGFGIARILTALTRVSGGAKVWISRYAAPERLAGLDGDARSDIYALAILTRELLCGDVFGDAAASYPSTAADALLPACPANLVALGFDDESWKETFARALSPNPDDRHPTATAFLASVTRVLGVTRPMTPRVWSASSRVVIGEAFADQSRWSDTTATEGATPGVSPRVAAEDDPVTWANSSVSPAQRLRAEPAAPADPDTTALAARVELQVLAPVAAAPADPVAAAPPAESSATPPAAPAPVQPVAPVPAPQASKPRPFPKAAALLIGLIAGALAVALVWYFVPAARHWLEPTTVDQSPPNAAPTQAVEETPPPTAPLRDLPRTSDPARTGTPPVDSSGPAPVAGATLGLLRITTTPAGARVTIDGKPRGVTPLRLGNLSLSTHTVQIALDGYASETPQVVLTSDRATQTLNLTLRPIPTEPAAAQLSVETIPAGADIVVDDQPSGRSPVALPKIAAGRHTVRAEREGFEPAARDVDLRGGESSTITIQLTPQIVAATGPIDFDRVQVKPRQTSGPASPGYPRAARAAKLTGAVVATWVVDEKGMVGGVTILEASSPLFETEVRDWLQSVRFVPGQQAGQPVKVIVKRRFSFALGR